MREAESRHALLAETPGRGGVSSTEVANAESVSLHQVRWHSPGGCMAMHHSDMDMRSASPCMVVVKCMSCTVFQVRRLLDAALRQRPSSGDGAPVEQQRGA